MEPQSYPSELPVLILETRSLTAALNDPDFRPDFIFEPLARAKARAQFPGCTVRYAQVYKRLPAGPFAVDPRGPVEIAVTHWHVLPAQAVEP